MAAPIIAAGVKALAPIAKDMALAAATQAVVAGVTKGVDNAEPKAAKNNLPTNPELSQTKERSL